MRILSAVSEERLSGIPLPDIESVKAALMLFNHGTRGSGATRQNLGQQNGLASMMLAMVQSSPGRFLETLFSDMEQRLEKSHVYSRSFDYDGYGSFFKTSVTVERVTDGSFVLSLVAAYVGNDVEAGLAESLGVQRGLSWSRVVLTLDALTDDDMFSINFNSISGVLRQFGNPAYRWTSRRVAREIAMGRKESYESKPYKGGFFMIPGRPEDIAQIHLDIDSISVESYWDHPFVATNGTVTGGSAVDWDDDTKKRKRYPVLHVWVSREHPANANLSGLLPILDESIKQDVRSTTIEVLSRFEALKNWSHN